MGNINWAVRIKSRVFWVALIPAIALLAQMVAAIFGITIDLSDLSGKVLAAVDALFAVLVIIGVVVDPTTEGVADSERALGYTAPAPNANDPIA